MDKNVNKSQENPNDDLMKALKLISDTITGPELRTIEDLVKSTDKARQASQSSMEQRLESALTKIREEAKATAATLREAKSEMDADRKKWQEEISSATDLMEKMSAELSQKIGTAETTLQANAKKLKEQVETNIFDLRQEHKQRFIAVEDRITRCENESNSHKEENNLLAMRLSKAAQSLVTGTVEDVAVTAAAMEQVDSLLTELDDGEPGAKTDAAKNSHDQKGSHDSSPNKNKYGRDNSGHSGLADVGAGYDKTKK